VPAGPERDWALARLEPAAHGGDRPRWLPGLFRYGGASVFLLVSAVLVVAQVSLDDSSLVATARPGPDVTSTVTRTAHSTAERLPLSAAESTPARLTGGTSDDAMALSDRPDRAAARERRAARREARLAAKQARREEGKARRDQARARRKEAYAARREAALARREAKRSQREAAADERLEPSESRRAATLARREERKARKQEAAAARREASESRHAAALARREERKAQKQEAAAARRESTLARREQRQQRREDAAQARRDAAQARRDAAQARRGGGSGTPGTLRVNSLPWAQVFIDDRMVGFTPQLALSVSPGSHHVRLVNPSFGMQKSFEIDIKAGQRVSRVELLEE
jgi:PEGA domain